MEAVKAANLALRFLLELAAIIAFGYWGVTVGDGRLMKALLGIVVPALVVVVWAVFVAPKATISIPDVTKVLLGLIILELAAAALFVAGQPGPAVAFGAIVLINAALMLVWRQ